MYKVLSDAEQQHLLHVADVELSKEDVDSATCASGISAGPQRRSSRPIRVSYYCDATFVWRAAQ